METKPLGIGIDAEFSYAVKMCVKHGIPFGVYYYGKVNSVADARKEARKTWATASKYQPLFYVYDVEETRLSNAMVEAWMDEMRKLGAMKVGLYIAHHLFTRYEKAAKKADFVWVRILAFGYSHTSNHIGGLKMTVRQELLEQLEDALIGLELVKIQEEDLEELESTPMTAEEIERMNAFFAATEQRTLKLIEDQFRTKSEVQPQERIRRMPLQKTIVIAAAIVLLLFAGLASAVATVPIVRVKVLELISSMGDGYVVFGAKDRADKSIKVPAEWAGDYFPSYIPEEYEFQKLGSNATSAIYWTADGKR